MTNLAVLLKTEILRLARKEVRGEVGALKKTQIALRAEVASLRKQVKEVQQQMRRLQRIGAAAPGREPSQEEGGARSLSARRVKSLRKRLGLSATDCAVLADVTAQTWYQWERTGAQPRASSTAERLKAVMAIASKAQAAAILESIRARAAKK